MKIIISAGKKVRWSTEIQIMGCRKRGIRNNKI